MNFAKPIIYNEIIYLEADENYSILHLTNGMKRISSFTLKYHQLKTETNGFLRINRSHLLNPDYIKSVYKVGQITYVRMSDGKEIKVSRRKTMLVESL